MRGYQTVEGEQYNHHGDVFYVGQRRRIKASGWVYGKLISVGGEKFTVKNIIHPRTDPDPECMFICAEFDEHVGGHNCAADTGIGNPPWEDKYLCKRGHGDYFVIERAHEWTEPCEPPEPSWEV